MPASFGRPAGRTCPDLLTGWQQRLAALDESADLAALEARLQRPRRPPTESWPKNCRPAASRQRGIWARRSARSCANWLCRPGVSRWRWCRKWHGGAVYGLEQVEFRIGGLAGNEAKPLAKVASGGELSRISLAIQVLTSRSASVPTLIFDEVDVGIGGGVAEIVGRLLRELGGERQVLCVTHLPQVAAQADWQWQVSKATRNGVTLECHSAVRRGRPCPGNRPHAGRCGNYRHHAPARQRAIAQTSLKSENAEIRRSYRQARRGAGKIAPLIAVYPAQAASLFSKRRPAIDTQYGGRGQRQRGAYPGTAAASAVLPMPATAICVLSPNSARKIIRKVVAKMPCARLFPQSPRLSIFFLEAQGADAEPGEQHATASVTTHSGNQAATAAPNSTASRLRMAKAATAPRTTGSPRWRAARVMQTSWLLSPNLGQRNQQQGGTG
jgi:hypothetical protein